MGGRNMNGYDMNDLNKIEELRQLEEMKKQLLTRILSKEAYERLSRVRMVNPTLASQVELYLIQIYQTGKLQTPVSDEKLKEVLKVLSSGGKEIKIKRK
ncbi:MAG: hypothetical protein DRP15_01125 [Candidatus Aenigmatarchaeota archaeon]|nr:MAG: hypothetical protein DRP15_01125 [Candidatus Aenigmarchaeota archaeon]